VTEVESTCKENKTQVLSVCVNI